MNKSALPVLILLFALLYLLPLGNAPLRQPDETRYAEISREMIESGDWVVPRLLGLRYFEKPVAGYWVNSLCQMLPLEGNFAVRFGPALCTGLGAALVFALGLGIWRRRGTAFYAALLYLSMLMVLGIGSYTVLDAIFTMWMTAAMACSWFCFSARARRGRVLAYAALGLACGMAFLTKGLPGPAMAVCAALPIAVQGRKLKELFLFGPLAILAAALVALPWGLAIAAREPDFWNYFFWVEHIQRFAGEKAQHREPFWFYLPWLAGGCVPWLGFLPGALKLGFAESLRRPGSFFLLSWLFMPFLLFSAASGKLPTYILPCMAPLALLLAFYIQSRLDPGEVSTEGRREESFAGAQKDAAHRKQIRPFRLNAWINLGLSLAALAAFPILFFDLTPGRPVYAPGEKFKLWLCVPALVWWGGCAAAALFRGGRYWSLAAASPLLLTLFSTSLLPWQVTDQREPEHIIAPHLEELKLCRHIFAGTVGLGAGLAFMLKRSDIRLYNEQGELAYGLSYPDSRDKSIGAADFPGWLAKARAEGPVAMLLRDREMEVGPSPDAVYRRGHLVLLIFRQE